MMTFFSHLAHHRFPFFSLKSGEAHAGQACSVRVDPWRSRSAMRLMCGSSVCFGGKFWNPKVNRCEAYITALPRRRFGVLSDG